MVGLVQHNRWQKVISKCFFWARTSEVEIEFTDDQIEYFYFDTISEKMTHFEKISDFLVDVLENFEMNFFIYGSKIKDIQPQINKI